MAPEFMSSPSPISQKVTEFLQKAQAENIHIKLCWIPGHTNEGSMKMADITSKNVVKGFNRILLTRAIPHLAMKRPGLGLLKQNCLEGWQSLSCEHKLREIKLDAGIWKASYNKSRRIETAPACLKIGQLNLGFASWMEISQTLQCVIYVKPYHS